MFSRLTENARKSVIAAQQAAIELGHPYVGTEHLLLGLAQQAGSSASQILDRNGVDVSVIAGALPPEQAAGAPGASVPFTARVKAALETARRLADQEDSQPIATRHVLAALLRDQDGLAYSIVARHGSCAAMLEQAIPSQGRHGDGRRPAAGTRAGGREAGIAALPALPAVLTEHGVSLTDLALRGQLDSVVGRDEQISRVIQVLCKRTKNNPVLVGDAGVGKTAVAEGLAQRIARGEVPEELAGVHLLSLDMGSLIAGTRYRGDFEAKLKKVIAAVQERSDVILFVDEMHSIVSAGQGESGMGVSSMLKPIIARGELRIVGATTMDEYRQHVEKDPALERRFCPVHIPEPGNDLALAMLRGSQAAYEAWHQVTYSDAALRAAVSLTSRYVTGRSMPDKAFDVVDEAGARAAIMRGRNPEAGRVVEEADIARLVAESTGIALPGVGTGARERAREIETTLAGQVVGQPEAVSALARALRRIEAGLNDARRPNGSFLFAGPTGVGKTEMAKAVARAALGDESALIAFDMSEFGEPHTVARLFGAPPGYVGHDAGGELTEKVRRRPYSVILLDEIEKAHPEVFNSFLQVLEEGRLTDGAGRVVDFSNTIVIFTSNAGSSSTTHAGFAPDETAGQAAKSARINAQVKAAFRPEFLNRMDEIVVFNSLTQDDVGRIAEIMAGQLDGRLRELGRGLIVTDQAVRLLATRGYDPAMGARPLRRVIQELVEDPISDLILSGQLPEGYCALLDAQDGQLSVTAQQDIPDAMEPAAGSLSIGAAAS